ncbi:MAG: type III polyketide synthase [Bacteroidota bacterium]
MPVSIHDIATAVPQYHNAQSHIRDVMKSRLNADRKTQAIIHRIYSQSGIETRHSVLDDFTPEGEGGFFLNGVDHIKVPGTAQRNVRYTEASRLLFTQVGEHLLSNNPHIKKEEITHVVTVSCTGFYAPGPDYELVKSLGLSPATQRFHVGFMGCYAAFPAMKMAEAFCKADPNAVVMIVCCELCTLHFQGKTDVDSLLSCSVFGDGAAGVLISAKPSPKTHLQVQHFASTLAMEGEKDMAWNIGDTGFDMVLSTYVPSIIEENLEGVVTPIIQQYNLNLDDVDYWAVHPGGRAILDKVEQSFEVKPAKLEASRSTLAKHGNMSSATVLFVLKELMDSNPESGSKVVPMAFGPGLTIESGLFEVA